MGVDPWATTTNGVFAPRVRSYSIADIQDGTSNTIAFVEALTGDFGILTKRHRKMISGLPGGSPPPPLFQYDARNNLNFILAMGDACIKAIDSPSPGPGSNSNRGWRWQTGSPGLSLTNIIVTPNSTRFQFSACRMDCGPGCGTDFGHLFTPSSGHPGGVDVLMADGSVKFIKDSVAMPTWISLGSRDGGEVVSSDSY